MLNLRGAKALVTGGTLMAARKIDLLLKAGAHVTCFAPELDSEFTEIKKQENFTHITRMPDASDFVGLTIAFGASEDPIPNQLVFDFARAAGVLVNIVDDPMTCDFIMPAIIDRSPIIVAFSSSGAVPVFARTLKARFETMIPKAYGRLAEFSATYRDRVKSEIKTYTGRRRFWEAIVDGDIAEHVFMGKMDEARDLADQLLKDFAADSKHTPKGEVYLVGAGPGDPDLLTFRALRLMQKCDVVLYDRLLGEDILSLVRREAERVYVGKMNKDHALPQEEISELLVKLARQGKRVLRLKGGDPFVFGRGGEEIEKLAAAHIPFQVVPGITAASGVSSYAGIPLTHRDYAQSVAFVTGHTKEDRFNLDLDSLVRPGQTVVVYMGLSSLPQLADAFIEKGASPDLPAAAVSRGTRPGQKVVTGTLSSLPGKVAKAGLESPTLIIIGNVVKLHDQLAWFEENASDEPTLGSGAIQAR